MRTCHIVTLALTAVVVVASPHHQVHRHAHGVVQRVPRPDNIVYAPVAIETVIKYVLDGHEISEEDVRMGLTNGTLEWGPDGILSTSANSPVVLPTQSPSTPPSLVPAPTSSSQPEQKPGQDSRPPEDEPTRDDPKTSEDAAPPAKTSSSAPDPTPFSIAAAAPPVDPSLTTPAQLVDKDGHCASCDTEFPNNKIPCSQFPYGYGAMPVLYEGLGGWSGIQDPVHRGVDGFDDITTVVSGSCKDGSCCKKGTFCSYGCPNPYLKLSFPKTQGKTGQSVGGLYCNENNMLEMADGSIGKTLCGTGSNRMTVKVQSKLSKPVSFCRTDYPGTESMTFPLTLGPGETGFLANPDQSKYFFWNGEPTSAHYYVNKQGVSEADGCTWSTPGEGQGNWAPTIFGTSWDDRNMNMGFSSLKQNELNKGSTLDYSITFTGDAVNSPCSYKKSTNQYCEGDKCWCEKDAPDQGCTASTKPGGTLTLVLHDD